MYQLDVCPLRNDHLGASHGQPFEDGVLVSNPFTAFGKHIATISDPKIIGLAGVVKECCGNDNRNRRPGRAFGKPNRALSNLYRVPQVLAGNPGIVGGCRGAGQKTKEAAAVPHDGIEEVLQRSIETLPELNSPLDRIAITKPGGRYRLEGIEPCQRFIDAFQTINIQTTIFRTSSCAAQGDIATPLEPGVDKGRGPVDCQFGVIVIEGGLVPYALAALGGETNQAGQ